MGFRERIQFIPIILCIIGCTNIPRVSQYHSINSTSKPCEIIILGTRHVENSQISHVEYVELLTRIKPDIILYELDSKLFRSIFVTGKTIPPADSLEYNTVIEYKKNKDTELGYYDIEGRNQFYADTNYFQRQDSLNRSLFSKELLKTVSAESKNILVKYIEMGKKFKDYNGLDEINSPEYDNFNKEYIYLEHEIILQVAQNEKSLEAHVDFARLRRDFWIKRNDTMIENIKRYARTGKYKRIIVLTGCAHCYYLRQGLMIDNEWYVLKYYNEY